VTPKAAAKILGLLPCETGSLRSVRAAFARSVRAVHPDVRVVTKPGETFGKFEIFNTPHGVGVYQMARDVLIERIASQNRACKLCSGRGKVRAGMGWRQCGACKGTGDRV
jgi:hypothetical protein